LSGSYDKLVQHLGGTKHLITWASYAARYTAFLGPTMGCAARHKTVTSGRSPFSVTVQCTDKKYRKWHLASPEGCVLPVLEAVREHLGELRFMLPAVWNRACAGKLVLKREVGMTKSAWVVKAEDIERLELGLVRWKMDEVNAQYRNPLVRYVSLGSLPATATEYVDMLMLKRPSQYVPDPFGAEFWTQVKENAVLKIPRPKIPEDMDPVKAKELKRRYERADQLLTMMPPASFDGAWYGVVRVHIRVGSDTAKTTGVIIILVCKEQLINCSFEEAVVGWEYNGVEFRAGGNIKDMVDFLEKRFAVVAKEKADGVEF
jgi:hypothetical protein